MYVQFNKHSRILISKSLICAGLTLTILLGIFQLYQIIDIFWTLIVIPTIISLAIFIYLFRIIIYTFCIEVPPGSKTFLLTLTSISAVFMTLFTILAAIRLDEIISPLWSVVFTPFWSTLVLFGVFCIFVIPGLLQESIDMKREASVLICYLLFVSCFSVMLPLKLDEVWQTSNWILFLPLEIMVKFHLIGYLIQKIKSTHRGIITEEIKYSLAVSTFVDLIYVQQVWVQGLSYWIIALPIFFYLVQWIYSEQKRYFEGPREKYNQLK